MPAVGGGVFWSLFIVLVTSSLHEVSLSMEMGWRQRRRRWCRYWSRGMMVMVNETRRKLASFQICSLCTCCGGASRSYCLPTPCCYAINCNIPNRPFGFCSFTPKTCNCFACHI